MAGRSISAPPDWIGEFMAKSSNGWAKQTARLSDKTYYSPTPGIWTDKLTKSDRRCQLTDNELKRHHGGRGVLADAFGNLPSRNKAEAARIMVERVMNTLTPAQRAKITPRMKWDLVAAVADSSHPNASKTIPLSEC